MTRLWQTLRQPASPADTSSKAAQALLLRINTSVLRQLYPDAALPHRA